MTLPIQEHGISLHLFVSSFICKRSNWQRINLQNKWTTYAPQYFLKSQSKNGVEYLNRHVFKEDIQMANKYMKRCSTSLIFREMQIKTMRYHLTQLRITIIKRSTNNKCWKWCGKNIRTFLQCWWECKLIQPQCYRSTKKKSTKHRTNI